MRSIAVLIFFLTSPVIYSGEQVQEKHFSAAMHVHYGYIIPRPYEVKQLSASRPYGIELNLSWLNTGYEKWKIFRTYNIAGFQAAWYNYQNPAIMGSSWVTTVFTEPVILNRKDLSFSMRAGGGFTYQTKIYRPDIDTINKLVSTHLSFIFYLSPRVRYQITHSTILTLSVNYNHISNGAIRIPNMGLNFATATLGIEYFPRSHPVLDNSFSDTRVIHEKKSWLVLQGMGGFRYFNDEPAGIFGASFRFTHQLNNYFALNAGAELIMDTGVKKLIESESATTDYKRLAATAGFDLFFGRFTVTPNAGLYLYSPRKARSVIYQKFELSYLVIPRLQTGIALKTFVGDVDLVALTVNYLIPFR